MRRRLIFLLVGAVVLSIRGTAFPAASPAMAAPRVMVRGGGTGTFGSDLDGDGDIDGS